MHSPTPGIYVRDMSMRAIAGPGGSVCRSSQLLRTHRYLASSCPNRRASCLARAGVSPRNEDVNYRFTSSTSRTIEHPSSEGSSSIAMTAAASAAVAAAAVLQASPAWAEDLQPSAVPAGYLGGDLVVAGFFYTVVALLSVVSIGVSGRRQQCKRHFRHAPGLHAMPVVQAGGSRAGRIAAMHHCITRWRAAGGRAMCIAAMRHGHVIPAAGRAMYIAAMRHGHATPVSALHLPMHACR